MASGNRISGNLARITFGGVAEGGATAPPVLNIAEFSSWSFPVDIDVEDTTPLGSDSPRVDLDMRRPGFIECEGLVSSSASATSPDGAPRLPYAHTDGVRSPATLTLIIDKTNPTLDLYSMSAHYAGCRTVARGPGGRKQRTIYRFIPTGAITQTSLGVATTIR